MVAKTNTRSDSRREPTWSEAFNIDLCHDVKYIKLRVRFPSVDRIVSTGITTMLHYQLSLAHKHGMRCVYSITQLSLFG